MKRRNLLKYSSALGLGLFTSPSLLWSKELDQSIKSGRSYIFKNEDIIEYSPSTFPKLSELKARLHWNENPYGPSKLALKAYKQNAKSANFYSWDILSDFTKKIAKNP